MHRYHRSSSLAPSGLVVGGLTVGPDAIDMTAYPASKMGG
jgi:hypothetical protein